MKLKSFQVLSFCALVAFATGSMADAGHQGGAHETEAIGKPGVASKVSRTVTIDMSDAMRFTPSRLTVRQGETIRFFVKNAGQMKHEFVLGTAEELQEHAALMKKFPGMEHADANMASVESGQSAEVIWQFTKAGKVEFACLQPGHFDAGMKGAVLVSASRKKESDAKTDDHAGHQH